MHADGDDYLELKYADHTNLIDVDASIRTAAWNDVRAKAMRLRKEGRVKIHDLSPVGIFASVEGDHGTYETMIAKTGSMGGYGGGQSISNWHCGCEWGRWAFKRKMSFVGRLCSHAYAAYLDMQSAYHQGNPGKFHHKSAGVVDKFKTWCSDNDQSPEPAAIADFVHTSGDDLDDGQVQQLYDYVQKNPEETRERKYDVGYELDPDKAYKEAGVWDYLKGEAKHENWIGPEFHDDLPVENTRVERGLNNFSDFMEGHPRHADVLHTRPQSLTPSMHAVPEGEEHQWVDVTKDDRETTGPDQIVHFSALARQLHGWNESDITNGIKNVLNKGTNPNVVGDVAKVPGAIGTGIEHGVTNTLKGIGDLGKSLWNNPGNTLNKNNYSPEDLHPPAPPAPAEQAAAHSPAGPAMGDSADPTKVPNAGAPPAPPAPPAPSALGPSGEPSKVPNAGGGVPPAPQLPPLPLAAPQTAGRDQARGRRLLPLLLSARALRSRAREGQRRGPATPSALGTTRSIRATR